ATHEDITERKRAEQELERTRAFLDTIIENVPSPIIVKEAPSLRYLLLNRAAEGFLGVERNTVLGKTALEVMPKRSAEMLDVEDRKALESRQAAFFDEHALTTPNGETRVVSATRYPVMGLDDQPQYLITVIRDLTENKRHEQRIAHLAHHDPLTDL